MKSFCVLEQGSSVGDPITAEKRRVFTTEQSDFFRLNWKRADDPDAFIAASNIMWSEGRSLLWEHVPKDYAYYVFIDDDVTFAAPPGVDVVRAIADFFARFLPFTGTFHDPRSLGFTFAPEGQRWDGIAHPIAGYDLQLQYFSRDFAEVMFPVPYHGSSGSMHYSHWACHKLYPGKQLAFYGVAVSNTRHAPHEDGIVSGRAHQEAIMGAFNQHTCDGSLDPTGRWNKASVHQITRQLQRFPIDPRPLRFAREDLCRIYDVRNPGFQARKSLRDPRRSPVSRPGGAAGPASLRALRFEAHRSAAAATEYLVQQAWLLAAPAAPHPILVVGGPDDPAAQELVRRLTQDDVACQSVTLEHLATAPSPVAAVVCGSLDVARIMATGRAVLADERLARVPFEAMPDLGAAYRVLRAERKDAEDAFVSPLLVAPVDVQALYEESLRHFSRTCQVRDFLDLAQVIIQVVARQVPGDVAEFGSYKGHSGYLIAQLLRALGSTKHLTMFDTFAGFPDEHGVDYFWTGGHATALAEVKRKLDGLDRVSFVVGDLTETLDPASLGPLALIYVDCDSFRATAHVLARLFEANLQPGGAVVVEDYGHAPLLGSRIAVHDFFDRRTDCSTFFSQFSGLYVAFKRAAA